MTLPMFPDLPVSLEPFRFSRGENAALSFSGGRTSATLLWHTLQAHGGQLPSSLRVIFCNTGKEMPQTLDFVRDCGVRWGVPIEWVEFRAEAPGYAVVDHATASRDGEPFMELIRQQIKRKDGTIGRRALANPVSRVCTTNLKTRLKKRYLKLRHGWDAYHMAVGFRADEGHRVATGFKYPEPGETLHYPLHAAGVGREDVLGFWGWRFTGERYVRDGYPQGFDLDLPVDRYGETIEGNCDLCFMKSAKKVAAIAGRHPQRARWWAEVEQEQALTDRPTTFRQDRPAYSEMLAAVERGEPMDFGIFDDLTSCSSNGCTD